MLLLARLDSAKSISRYTPPNGTAGFARSAVSGARRVPAPPASTIPRTDGSGMTVPPVAVWCHAAPLTGPMGRPARRFGRRSSWVKQLTRCLSGVMTLIPARPAAVIIEAGIGGLAAGASLHAAGWATRPPPLALRGLYRPPVIAGYNR